MSKVVLSCAIALANQRVRLFFTSNELGTYLSAGVLLDNAQDILKLPELTESDLLRQFKVTVRDAHRYGITSIHDAGLDPKSLAFFKRFIQFPVLLSCTYSVGTLSSFRQAETGTLPVSSSFCKTTIMTIPISGSFVFME